MKKWNHIFLTFCGLMVLGLSACASVERNTASSIDDSDHFKPYLADR